MRYVRQKLIQLVIVVIAVTFLTFISINLLPGDPAIFKAGPGATDAQVEQVRHDLGLDKPIPVQYGIWLKKMVTLDFGVSLGFNTPVSDLVRNRLPVTLVVLFYSLILSLIIAIPLGVFSAYRAGSTFDRASSTVAFGLLSVPSYIIGVVLLYFFAVKWGWFPAISKDVSLFQDPVKHFKAYGLPVITLAVAQIAVYMRLLRTDMHRHAAERLHHHGPRQGHVHPPHPVPPRVAAIALLARSPRRPSTSVRSSAAPSSSSRSSLSTAWASSRSRPSSAVTSWWCRSASSIFAVGFVLINFFVDLALRRPSTRGSAMPELSPSHGRHSRPFDARARLCFGAEVIWLPARSCRWASSPTRSTRPTSSRRSAAASRSGLHSAGWRSSSSCAVFAD